MVVQIVEVQTPGPAGPQGPTGAPGITLSQYTAANPVNVRTGYGAVGNGVTDDSAAFVNALTENQGKTIYVPSGTYNINSATRLLMLGNQTTLLGDESGIGTIINFTNVNGGLDIGNGVDNIYENRLVNITLVGGGVANNIVRMRRVYEPYLNCTRIEQAAQSLILMEDCGQLDGNRLVLQGAPKAIRITGDTVTPVVTITLGNFFQVSQSIISVEGAGLAKMLITNSWAEACPDWIVFDRPAAALQVRQLVLKDCWNLIASPGTSARFIKATAGTTGIGASQVRIEGCIVEAPASTSPLIDFSSVDNSSSTFRCQMIDLDLNIGGTGPLIAVHSNQAWWMFQTVVERIRGVPGVDNVFPTSRWTQNPNTTGGTWPHPYDLTGTGSPEGAVSAPVGSRFVRGDGAAGATFYVKESGGNGNTGWAAK